MDDLSKSILATVIYYDVLDFSLTSGEVFNFLINPTRFGTEADDERVPQGSNLKRTLSPGPLEIILFLDALVKNKELEEKNGFYFLSGRADLYEKRIEKNKIAEEKWKKARRYLFWVQAIPFIEAVWASGSLALGHTGEESDLDVLVVVKKGRIWLARVFLSLTMSLLRVRRKNGQKFAPNKICLNHYITDQSLKIPFESLYNAQSYAHLVPVYWRNEKIITRFWEANKTWMEKFLCSWEKPDFYQRREIRRNKFLKSLKLVVESILECSKLAPWLEKLSRKIQISRINTSLPGRIVANDQQLEFHPYSAEKDIIKKYNQHIAQSPHFGNYQETDSGLR